jgi:inosose dehydratase
MKVRVGSSPDSWGVWFPKDSRQIPWQRFLDEVAEAGYDTIELGPYGYLPTDVSTLRSELESRGLKVSGGFAMADLADPSQWPEIERQVVGASTVLQSLGAGFLVLIDDTYTDLFTAETKGPARLNDEAWKRLIDSTHQVADIAQDRFGMKLVFHPHAETHVEYDDQIDLFLAQTDPDRVFICLDIGHHAYRGGDPVDFIRRHHQRIPYLHLKSVDPDIQRNVEENGTPFATAVAEGMFCEPWEGKVDFMDFRDVLHEVDFDGWGIVEQDMYPAPFDKPLPIATRTRKYLRDIGIG